MQLLASAERIADVELFCCVSPAGGFGDFRYWPVLLPRSGISVARFSLFVAGWAWHIAYQRRRLGHGARKYDQRMYLFRIGSSLLVCVSASPGKVCLETGRIYDISTAAVSGGGGFSRSQ